MNMTPMDWIIVVAFTRVLFASSLYTRKYVRSVADFLVANRCAGRYLLCISIGAAELGAVAIVARMQVTYNVGLANTWLYTLMASPIAVLLCATGWIVYRFRETRALTLAQFFEMRYSRKFRIFAGMIAFLAGMLIYGIFPAIGANFFINFCGLPSTVGPIPTFHLMMFILLGISPGERNSP